MGKIRVSKAIKAPASKVWEVIADFGNIHRFHPHLSASPVVGERARGLGARRCCEFEDGTLIEEEVVSWNEGEGYRVRLTAPHLPFHWAEAAISVEPADEGGSKAHMRLDYGMKYGFFGDLLNALFLRYRLKSLFGEVVAGLDHHVTTGEFPAKNVARLSRSEGRSRTAVGKMTPEAGH